MTEAKSIIIPCIIGIYNFILLHLLVVYYGWSFAVVECAKEMSKQYTPSIPQMRTAQCK